MESMYKGKSKFSREQLIFVCETFIVAALDRIEASLPTNITRKEYKENEVAIISWQNAAIETASTGLAIFYAQLTDDGIGVGDAMDLSKIQVIAKKMIKERTSRKFKGIKIGEQFIPNCREFAENFVHQMWDMK